MWGYLWGKGGVMQRWALRFLDCAQLPPKTFSGFHQKVSLDLCSKKDKFSGCHKKMSNQLIGTKPLVQLRISALDVYFHLSVIAEDRFLKSAHFYYDYVWSFIGSLPCLVSPSLSHSSFCSNCWICQSYCMDFPKLLCGFIKPARETRGPEGLARWER